MAISAGEDTNIADCRRSLSAYPDISIDITTVVEEHCSQTGLKEGQTHSQLKSSLGFKRALLLRYDGQNLSRNSEHSSLTQPTDEACRRYVQPGPRPCSYHDVSLSISQA